MGRIMEMVWKIYNKEEGYEFVNVVFYFVGSFVVLFLCIFFVG